jgi:hypothetical protein
MRSVSSQIFGHDLKCEGVSSWSHLGRWSRRGRLTAAPISDCGGVMHRAATPWPLLRWGSPGAMASLSRRGQLRSATTAAWRTERRRHGPYSSEAARGLWRAFLDEVYPYGGGTGRWTNLRGSWAVAVIGAVRVMVTGLLWSSATAGAHGGGSPMIRSSPAALLRLPLASPRLQLRRATARAKAVAQFGPKICTI